MSEALPLDETFSQRLSAVKAKMEKETHPEIIAVTKRQPQAAIDGAIAAGHRLFGENRVQEAQKHWELHRKSVENLKLHLIGPLQTNKAQDAVELFDVIETLDRLKLAKALAAAEAKTGVKRDYFIQVNTGEEPQKAGVDPNDLAELFKAATEEQQLSVTGLMCIPPVDEPAGPHFALLAKLAKRLGLRHLSMGMSGDYQTAAKFGATYVRLGTALFGGRS